MEQPSTAVLIRADDNVEEDVKTVSQPEYLHLNDANSGAVAGSS
jgi:hypothetical protein